MQQKQRSLDNGRREPTAPAPLHDNLDDGVFDASRRHARDAHNEIDDPIEYWGVKIGRALGLIMTIGILCSLVFYIFAGK